MRLLSPREDYLYMGKSEKKNHETHETHEKNKAASSIGLFSCVSCISWFRVESVFHPWLCLLCQNGLNGRNHLVFPHRSLFSQSEILDFPDFLGKLVRPGDERDLEAAAFGILELLPHFLR